MGFLIALIMKTGISEKTANIVLKTGALLVLAVLINVAYSINARHHFNLGVEHCETEQVKSDEQVAAIIPDVVVALDAVEDEKEIERVEVHKTYTTGLTASDIKLARQEGLAAGEKAGRSEVYEEIRESGGCLNQLYDANDRLRIKARAQQQRLFQTGVGRYEREPAETKLPIRGVDVNTFSDGEPVGYKSPY